MSKSVNHDKYLERLDRRIWITRGSRFNAARRLQRKHRLSISSIAILSIYGIAIAVLQSNSRLSQCPSTNEFYTFIAIVLSVFTLVLSLLEGYQDYQSRAQRLHMNAVYMSSLLSELEFASHFEQTSADLLREISKKYEVSIQDCPDNHETEDCELFQATERQKFGMTAGKSTWIHFKVFFLDYWLYISSVLSLPVLIIFLFFSC